MLNSNWICDLPERFYGNEKPNSFLFSLRADGQTRWVALRRKREKNVDAHRLQPWLSACVSMWLIARYQFHYLLLSGECWIWDDIFLLATFIANNCGISGWFCGADGDKYERWLRYVELFDLVLPLSIQIHRSCAELDFYWDHICVFLIKYVLKARCERVWGLNQM